MSAQQQKSSQTDQPRELWEIYNIHDFIDAKDNQGDWRVGYIVDKTINTRFFKVRFDGWSQKYDEMYRFTSTKLLDFRSVVVGYTGQKKNPGIRNEWKFSLPDHVSRFKSMQQFYMNIKEKSAWEINQTLRGHNYFYTDFLMTRTIQTQEAFTAIMEYFKLNIKIAINYLKNIDENFVQYYKGLENNEESYLANGAAAYAHSFYEILDTMYIISGSYSRFVSFFSDNEELLRQYLNIDQEKNVKKSYQLFIVDQFSKKGGFQAYTELLGKKLLKSECVIPFLFLKSLASLYSGISSQVSRQDREPFLSSFVEITKKNIKKLKDKDIKYLAKNHVSELLEAIRILYTNMPKEKEIDEWTLETQIFFCQKMIQCPFFEKKLKGVTGLIDLCEKKKNHFDGQIFVSKLIKINMFECLFSFDNAEIIKKSVELCKLLFQNNLLPQKQIYEIWSLRVGKHEAALQEIYSLFANLPSRTENDDFNVQLFEEISKVPEEEWDEDYIKMIKDYTLLAIGWASFDQEINRIYGFNLVYRYTLKKQNQFSFTALSQIFDRLEKSEFMKKFVRSCFEKIDKNIDSYPHIVILAKIVKDQVYNFKEENVEIAEILLNDILRSIKDSYDKVNLRFDLFSQIMKMLGINLTFEEFIKLYKNFKNTDNYNIFLNWVQKKREGGKMQINNRISSDIRKNIFNEIWDENAEFSKLSNKQTQIFIQFFKSINVFEGRIKKSSSPILKVENLNLHGLDRIWKAFQTVQSIGIAQVLAELLAEIYMCPIHEIEEKKEEWVKILINLISEKMGEAYKKKDTHRLERLLIIPKKIIDRDEEIFTVRQGKMLIPKEYTITHKVTKEEKVIKFNLGWSCYEFKKQVAERFKIPLRKCKLSHKEEPVSYDNYFKTMAECSLHHTTFDVDEEDTPSIKACLNSELQLFFELLGDPKLEKLVWQIMEKLPIAKEFMMKIEKSQKPWEEINNPSIYKELYMMRVMNFMKEEWWQLFIKGKGIEILGQKFKRVTAKSKIEREYLKVLCEAIEKCLNISGKNIAINSNQLVLNLFNSLHFLLENVERDDEKENKRNTVEGLIIVSIFKICEKLSAFVNPFSILLNNFEHTQILIQRGLIIVKNQFLRKEFLIRFQLLTKNLVESDSIKFLALFLEKLFNFAIHYPIPEQTKQYFLFTSNLIGQLKATVTESYLHEKNPTLINKIDHLLVSQAGQRTVETVNHMIVGYLQLLKELVRFSQFQIKKRLSNFILYKCFFSLSQNQVHEVKCKSKQSRYAAFDLLKVVLKDKETIAQTINFLSKLHKTARWRSRKIDDWTLTPGDKQKSASGYVGIKNLGCTCYMNSFFQQIFMIPNFRKAILECEDPIYSKEGEVENVLFQVKKMFFNLCYSEQKYYTPTDFCNAFKDYQGNPTKVNEQMDIDEFSGILFDRLEGQMKGTNYENVVKDFFGGIFSNEIICKGCPHFSETEESFLSVSLSVKNKKNIYQSFDTMIKGDTLDGDNAYFCERCNKKVSAVKRVCLKSLPDHLILTLKRFQFDYETMNKVKVNDYCEFPTQLNLKEYSQQFLRKQQNPDRFEDDELFPNSYYEYVLKGVAIHLGYADSGHYYSYINERKDNGKWFEFNDTIVRPFDIRRLGEEAFGGEVGTFQIKEKIKNAYMLIYERKSKIKDPLPKIEKPSLENKQIYDQMLVDIKKTNMLQKIQNILFSEEYTSRFAMELIKQIPKLQSESANNILKYIILVYLTVTIREKEELIAFTFLKKIHQILPQHPEICQWVIRVFSAQTSIVQFFKNNSAKSIKKLLAYWLIDIAKYCTIDTIEVFIDNILVYITKTGQNLMELCLMLYEIMKIEKPRNHAIRQKVVGRLLENVLRKEPGVYKDLTELKEIPSLVEDIGEEVIIERTPYELSKKIKPHTDNGYVWGILCLVFENAKKEQKLLEEYLEEDEVSYINFPVLRAYKILQECKCKFEINKFTTFLTYRATDNEKLSDELTTLIYRGLKEFQSKRYRQFFVLFKKLIHIKDSYPERIRKSFAKVLRALQDNEKYTLDCNIIQQWIVKTLKKSLQLQKILVKDVDSLKYLTDLSTKKIPSEEFCRKNAIFQENTVNKYHGIKMMKSKKGYIELSKKVEQFYEDLGEKKPLEIDDWESDCDLTEEEIQAGDKIALFDQKDMLDFVEAKVDQVFLNRLTITSDKSQKSLIWKDDEKLTSCLYKFTEDEESEDILYSENTTEMDPNQLLDI